MTGDYIKRRNVNANECNEECNARQLKVKNSLNISIDLFDCPSRSLSHSLMLILCLFICVCSCAPCAARAELAVAFFCFAVAVANVANISFFLGHKLALDVHLTSARAAQKHSVKGAKSEAEAEREREKHK